MWLHALVGFVKHGQAKGRNVGLHMVIPRFRLATGMTPASSVSFEGHFPTLETRVYMGTASVAWVSDKMLGGGLGSAVMHCGVEVQLLHKGYGVASMEILKTRHPANQTGAARPRGAVEPGQAQRYNHKG